MQTKLHGSHFTLLMILNLAAGCESFADASAADKEFRLGGGQDFAGWRRPTGEWAVAKEVALDPADATKFSITPGRGIIFNGPKFKTQDLVTKAECGDAQIHVEFCVSKHSNSGVYLMDRYEVQIYDSFGVERDEYPGIECGGIYPRWINQQNIEGHSPRVNASKPPGQWQTFDITFRAPRFDARGQKIANARVVKVLHNGKLIQENVELHGVTRGALPGSEAATGPLRLQGDHGPVAFRNLRVRPLALK